MFKLKARVACVIFIGLIMFNLMIGLASANSFFALSSGDHDEDNDGIDDRFEEMNRRYLNISFQDNESTIKSFLARNESKDLIEFKIIFDEDGLQIITRYDSEYESSEDNHDYEIEYAVIFSKIIEYNDSNGNNMYDPEQDQKLKEIHLNSWKSMGFSNYTHDGSNYYMLSYRTTNNIFRVKFYFVEEFEKTNNSLITPNEAKFDIMINYFNYSNPFSKLSLKVDLESESEYSEVEETEDEKEDYASDEEGVLAKSTNGSIGFFTWSNKARVDNGVWKNITASPLIEDNESMEKEILYLNYPRGFFIIHDPKIGIVRIFTIENPLTATLLMILTVVLVIGSIAAPLYYFMRKRVVGTSRSTSEILSDVSDKNVLHEILDQDATLKNLPEDINITVVPPNFLKKVNQLKMDEEEKEQFIKEMLALSPSEIEKILDDMLKEKDI